MILPPLVIDVVVNERSGKRHRVWLPFFLLWPVLLIIVVPALIVSVIVDFVLIVSGARYHHFTLLIIGVLRLLAEVRGTHVNVDAADNTVIGIDIY